MLFSFVFVSLFNASVDLKKALASLLVLHIFTAYTLTVSLDVFNFRDIADTIILARSQSPTLGVRLTALELMWARWC